RHPRHQPARRPARWRERRCAARADPRRVVEACRPLQRIARQPARGPARAAQGRDVLHRWLMAHRRLTHLDAGNRPAMVDVGAKEVTQRLAVAEATIRLPRTVALAALTIYDMCKALSHDIEITGVRLVEKSGGRRRFARAAGR